jgi:hypothetical protein
MEHIYENQQPNEPLAHDVYIQNLGHENTDQRIVLERVKQFGRDFAHDETADKDVLGKLVCGALDIPEEMVDDESVKDAKQMVLFGSMAALYVGNEMTNGAISNNAVMNTSSELMKYSPRVLLNDAAKFVEGLDPNTRSVLERWKAELGGENGMFFDAGFGAMMCSVNKTIYEIAMFRNLESTTDWDELSNEASPESNIKSVDDDCLMLAEAFQSHSEAVQFDQLPAGERQTALQEIAKLLLTDVYRTKELKPKDYVQTRGIGSCIGYDEHNEPEDMYEYGDAVKIRGRLARVDCMSVPTEFAMMMGDRDEPYQPQVCLVLDSVELVEPNGDVTPHDNCVAIPLRISGTTQLDKIIDRSEV